MSRLHERQDKGHEDLLNDPMFECTKCRLDAEIKFVQKDMRIVVTVWQYVGGFHALRVIQIAIRMRRIHTLKCQRVWRSSTRVTVAVYDCSELEFKANCITEGFESGT